jgi:ligand-binding SRPBCC domain-containing protein
LFINTELFNGRYLFVLVYRGLFYASTDAEHPRAELSNLFVCQAMPNFVQSVIIEAPVVEVFRFHERPDALALLTPSFPPVRVIQRTGGIESGARVELRVGVFRWIAVHTAFVRNQYFQDEQVEGPFAKWVHRHEFEPVAAYTKLTDRIDYELPGGALVNRLFSWAVSLGLSNMFAHRHRVTKRVCEQGPV